MSIVKSRNPETGIVYVYSSESYFDEQEKKYRYKRRVIGKLDENGNTVPTGPRGGYHPRKKQSDSKPDVPTVSVVHDDAKPDKKAALCTASEAANNLSDRLKDSEEKNRQLEQQILLLQKDLADTQKKLDHVRNALDKVLADIS